MKNVGRANPSAANASQIVSDFLTAFLSGNHDRAACMLTSDFFFRAPLLRQGGDRTAYFAGAEEKVKYIRGFHILRQWADGNDVSTVYELDIKTPAGTAMIPISEWHTIRDGKVASILMVFDSAAEAARLLGTALAFHH